MNTLSGAAGAGAERSPDGAGSRRTGAAEHTEVLVATPVGEARISWYHAARPRVVLALGHGAGGGTATRDLRALATRLPPGGVTVALVDQPWRVAGKKVAPAPRTLDTAWTALWPALADPGWPVVAGGRSAGARVACRTGAALGAAAVLALAFPLHPPGRPEKSRAAELTGTGLRTLVVQGGRDPFGRPAEFPAEAAVREIPDGDHGFAVPRTARTTERQAMERLVEVVADWLSGVPG